MGKYLKYLLLAVVVFLGLYWVYQKVFNPASRAQYREEVKNLADSQRKMTNGRTYYSVAEEIFNHIYWNWWIFSFPWKNTDEKALGQLLQTVSREEFPTLCEIYLFIKKADGPDQNPLIEDLRKTFNEKEMRQYVGHLVDL